jgi:hypothetical protein
LVPYRDEIHKSSAASKSVTAATDGGIRSHALTERDRAKWRFWNGQFERGLICLVHLMARAGARSFEHIPPIGKLEYALSEMIRYLELNADSMPFMGIVTVPDNVSLPVL